MLCEHRLLIAQVVCDEPSDDNSSKAAARAEQTKTPDLSPGLCKLETASLFKNEKSDRLGRHGTESQPWRGSPNQMYERRRGPPEAPEGPRSTRFSRQDRKTNK